MNNVEEGKDLDRVTIGARRLHGSCTGRDVLTPQMNLSLAGLFMHCRSATTGVKTHQLEARRMSWVQLEKNIDDAMM